jgi:hypothetical protein
MVANSDVAKMTTTPTNTIPPEFKVHEKEESFYSIREEIG